MKIYKVLYWSSTVIMVTIFLFTAGLNIFSFKQVGLFYSDLGFPVWLVMPVGFLKLAALGVILSRKFDMVKEWAYAGLFFDAILALTAHQISGDGMGWLAMIAGVAVLLSRIFEEKVYPEETVAV
ncbi:MAG TPA: DoxX family protein [Saprospiraceae bacterium]|nr:DoxX family protein [Saprospiraceae bacterium]